MRRQRKRVFRAWRREIRLRVTYFEVEDNHQYLVGVRAFKGLQMAVNYSRAAAYVSQRHAHQVRHSILRRWYSLLNEKLRLRLRLQKKRDFSMLTACFDQFRDYANKRTEFKKGMKALLKTRANNLMRRAYVQGLRQVWH